MKIGITEGTIQRSNIGTESPFKIAATAKAFQVLSSGLYSDKIRAIIRELGCNAYDAQIEANNDVPFLLHLPNAIEPYFSIRDYGVGLSDTSIENVFKTYFESTKTDSNDMIGCMGLGSKSPFCYTDSFTITSFYNGVKSIHTAFLDQHRIPNTAKLSEMPTEEHNGLEIRFPVASKDFYAFSSKTPTIFEYFKTKPTIVGSTVEHNNIEYFIQRKGWGVRSRSHYGQVKVVMGNVAYPISSSDIASELSPVASSLLNLDMDIFFNIGEVDVAASREKLSFDPDTKQVIKDRLKKVAAEVLEEIHKKVDDCKSLWAARVLVYSLRSGEYSVFDGLLKASTHEFKWHGTNMYGDGSSMIGCHVKIDSIIIPVTMAVYTPATYRSTARMKNTAVVAVKDKIHIFVEDKSKCRLARCDQYFNDVLKGAEDNTIICVKPLADDVNTIEAFRTHLGMLPSDPAFVDLSTLPYDSNHASTGVVNPKNSQSILVYAHGTSRPNQKCNSYSYAWNTESVDLNAGGIYVKIDRYKIDGHIRPDDYFGPRYTILKAIGIDFTSLRICGLKPKGREKVYEEKYAKKWIKFDTYVMKKVAAHFTKHNLLSDFVGARTLNDIRQSRDHFICEWLTRLAPDFSKDVDMLPFINRLKVSSKNSNLFADVHNAGYDQETFLNHVPTKFKKRINAAKTIHETIHAEVEKATKAFEKYEMLKAVDTYKISYYEDCARNYINLVQTVKSN